MLAAPIREERFEKRTVYTDLQLAECARVAWIDTVASEIDIRKIAGGRFFSARCDEPRRRNADEDRGPAGHPRDTCTAAARTSGDRAPFSAPGNTRCPVLTFRDVPTTCRRVSSRRWRQIQNRPAARGACRRTRRPQDSRSRVLIALPRRHGGQEGLATKQQRSQGDREEGPCQRSNHRELPSELEVNERRPSLCPEYQDRRGQGVIKPTIATRRVAPE